MGLRYGGESSKEAAVHLRDHEYVWLHNSVAFQTMGASCKAETKPILINPCKQEHLAMHLPAGLDADLNNDVSHTL